ncbi:hypothetical protein HMPREF9431_02042 [Segatella oulorum F0390]|uniref:Uncharacterized protein n=1 Tax=Segatella oulorum F0390 TaxID=702438 RepID=G1WDZ1_9BACT|nr:hypothetical protein HMPREF9431_02042 [Segatella oulorum F0390]
MSLQYIKVPHKKKYCGIEVFYKAYAELCLKTYNPFLHFFKIIVAF